MAENYCTYIIREPLKGWGQEGGFWRDRGPAPQVYYCAKTSSADTPVLCVADVEGMFRHSDHGITKLLERCPARTLDKKLEKD